MSQLGEINFTDLPRYLIKAADFQVGQSYATDALKELSISRQSQGVIYGCDLSVLSGLSVQISAGLVLFPNGKLVAVQAQNIALNAADATNPRLDRIELAYSLVDGTTVTNIDGASKVLNRNYRGTIANNTGTPGASPSVNSLTANSLSLGIARVNAGAVTLITANLDKTPDTALTVSALSFGATGTAKIRYNAVTARFELTEDGTTWLPMSRRTYDDITFAIANNQAVAANVTGLSFDATKYIAVKASVCISLQSDTPTEFTEVGLLFLSWKPKSAAWDIRFVSNFDDSGVVFSVTTTGSVGQVQYTSPNIAGSNYAGKLRVNNIVVQSV